MSKEITFTHDFTNDISEYFLKSNSDGNSPSNVTLVCEDQSYHCEMMILLLSNSFWRNILQEDDNVILLPDYDGTSIQKFLEILHTGNCNFQSTHDLNQLEVLAKNISLGKG